MAMNPTPADIFDDESGPKSTLSAPISGPDLGYIAPLPINTRRTPSAGGQKAVSGEIMTPAKPQSIAEAKRQAKEQQTKLTSRFTKDMRELWEEQGQSIMRRAAFADPLGTMKVIASMLPKQIDVTQTQVEEIDNDKLDRLIDAVDGILSGRLGKAEGAADS